MLVQLRQRSAQSDASQGRFTWSATAALFRRESGGPVPRGTAPLCYARVASWPHCRDPAVSTDRHAWGGCLVERHSGDRLLCERDFDAVTGIVEDSSPESVYLDRSSSESSRPSRAPRCGATVNAAVDLISDPVPTLARSTAVLQSW